MELLTRSARWATLLVITILLVGCNEERDFTYPEFIQINEAVYSNAIILPEYEYQVFSPVNGLIEKVFIQEGDTVQAGDLLFKIKDDNVRLNSQSAAIDVALAQASLESQNDLLDELSKEIDNAQSKLSFDSIQFERQSKLWAQQIGTRAEVDAKKLNYDTAKKQLTALQSKYNRLKTELTLALDKSKKNLEKARINSDDFLIRSKIDGVVYGMFKEAGESSNNAQALAEIGSADQFIIKMEVDEFDISKIRLGQKIALQMDAYQDKIFDGTLAIIYPKLNQATKSFTVEGTFDNPPDPLYSGLNGEANIIIGQKDSVLVIPTSYLGVGNTVQSDTGIIKVKTGIQNMNYTEITEGIDADTKIIMPENEN
ncbi:MAG: HlyD family efflux transporter periplasmic adaptor subunit [Saprospiraceae bacterium]|nr:HlyD family efflux transporter periplasmic adaptor subunit [Saprospiraceae bacterium]